MAYRILCGVLGAVLVAAGLGSFVSFFAYHGPGSAGAGPIPIGPGGAYYVAFLGCALVAWGGGLLGEARRPGGARWLPRFTALALVMSALYRMVAWIVGDYVYLGELLRVEAAVFLLLALGFVWLTPRPSRTGEAA